ncbi:16S rRNA (cytidine(1402)-2'-O)-methyltransferase [Turicibacter sanguinis]|nr:16S rRNA (cytidine(1402)-2'-O)-methyltransferase [Turicibacter sanguinis]
MACDIDGVKIMQIQKSFKQDLASLYLVATPIGNLGDMTPRGIEVLKSVDMIAAEDTRHTKKLCHVYEIETTLTSYHEHNKGTKGDYIIELLSEGKNVALVSDAGLPCISDPGYEIVAEAIKAGFAVIPVPGANAALSALIASGLVPQPFLFYGFLNRVKSKKKKELEELKYQPFTTIYYESPHRIKETLQAMQEVLGNRRIVIARELTKQYEEFVRGTVEECLNIVDDLRGEMVVIVEGSTETKEETLWWQELEVVDHVEHYVSEGFSTNESIKRVAKERGLAKNEVYRAYHVN